jgi:hypothetical protein
MGWMKNRLEAIQELGCGILTLLFISLPVWVLTTAWRGPLYAVGALIVLFSLVFAVAYLGRLVDRLKSR